MCVCMCAYMHHIVILCKWETTILRPRRKSPVAQQPQGTVVSTPAPPSGGAVTLSAPLFNDSSVSEGRSVLPLDSELVVRGAGHAQFSSKEGLVKDFIPHHALILSVLKYLWNKGCTHGDLFHLKITRM